MKKALWSGTSDFFLEKQYVRKDGVRIDVDVTTKIMKNADGSVRYFASIIQDVSERKKGERLLEKRAAELEKHREAIIDGMAVLAEYRDMGTGNHVRRTKQYVKLLLERSGSASLFPEKDLPMIWQCAVLHDIGKVGVPDAVLLKPGGLTPEEFGVIRRHPSIGSDVLLRAEELLGSDSFITYARQITEYHHERWDGTGYPTAWPGRTFPFLPASPPSPMSTTPSSREGPTRSLFPTKRRWSRSGPVPEPCSIPGSWRCFSAVPGNLTK